MLQMDMQYNYYIPEFNVKYWLEFKCVLVLRIYSMEYERHWVVRLIAI